MRSLVVAADYPWPRNSGSRIRLSLTLEGLARCGPVDLFALVSANRRDLDPPPPSAAPERVEHVGIDDAATWRDRVRALTRRDLPFELPAHETARVSGALARFVDGAPAAYDLVWCFRVRAWLLGGEPAWAPVVVDLDDLEDQKIAARVALAGRMPAGAAARWRRRASTTLARHDLRRWRRLHERIDHAAAASVVCSELDAGRSGLAGVCVVVNGYEPPAAPVGRVATGSPPTVVFHGTLRYPPNADAARFVAEEVAPRLRALVPGAAVRLVGRADPATGALHDPPRVTVTGQVPDVTAELARADVVVVPLRFASGTRVKILEAFAHRIPVVASTIGAEGIDADDGVHLLIADDAEATAGACARLLTDPGLRARMVQRAETLFLERYTGAATRDAVTALAKEVTSR